METAASPLAKLDALADGVLATLRTARGLVDSGRRIDLAGLDDMVGLLCAQALDLPPAEGRAALTRLEHIGAELDLLAAVMPAPA
jgi:hypothetical protein